MDVYGVEFPCSAPTNKSVYVKNNPRTGTFTIAVLRECNECITIWFFTWSVKVDSQTTTSS